MFQKLLKKIACNLERTSIPYMIVDGQAVLLYGEPRLTRDIDVILGMGIEGLDKLENVVSKIGLKILPSEPEKFVLQTMVLPTIDEKSGIRIDFIFSFSLYESEAIKRAKTVKLGQTAIKFASLEDVVIHKIIAGRARDIEDVKSILLKNPGYDCQYIEKWLKEFEISTVENFSDLFKRIVDEIK